MVVLALVVFGYFIRTVLGPHFADRIVAVNSISTIVMSFKCIFFINYALLTEFLHTIYTHSMTHLEFCNTMTIFRKLYHA